jgi:DNA-binding NarL/FixJ family response regulator
MFSPKTALVDDDQIGSAVRVLVVDDYEPFRRFVCSTLERRTDLQVVGEASDGSEAVQKAEELQPDLIVLDIGLPSLNGIEAARRIRKLSPGSKILVLTQESSADVVQEVLSAGALGYVVKAHAGSELLTAVEAVCQGRKFVSRGISDGDWTSLADAQVADHPPREEASLSLAPAKRGIDHNHAVQFYPDDASFLVGFTRFIEAGLKDGKAVIVVATQSHWKNLLQRLRALGLNVDAAIEEWRLIPLDVSETLATFMVNDVPDPVRFRKSAGELVAVAAKAAQGKPPRVAACGECSLTLWAQGNTDAAVQVEHLCDEIAKIYEIDILCGYVLNALQRKRESHIYERICAEHAAVYSQ